MTRRLRWFGMGVVAGATGAVWGLAAVRRTSDRLQPDRVGAEVLSSVRDLGGDVRAAIVEGRSAMRAREQELLEARAVRAGGNARAGGAGGMPPLR